MASHKTKMSVLDVRCAVNELKSKILNLRLVNVYDINFSRRMYLLKFGKANTKCQVLIESGTRFHTTEWKRNKNDLPSAFVMRLRKFLRSRRLTDFKQLGADRVIDFIFGSDASATHLIIELYVAGNVILADANYKILSILRPHSNVEEAGNLAVNTLYPVHLCYMSSLVVRHPSLFSLLDSNETISEDIQERIKDLLIDRLEALKQKRACPSVNKNLKINSKKKSMNTRDTIAYLLPFAHHSLIQHGFMCTQSEQCEMEHNSFFSDWETLTISEEILSQAFLARIARIVGCCLHAFASVSSKDDYFGEDIHNLHFFPRVLESKPSQGFIVSLPCLKETCVENVLTDTIERDLYKNEEFIDFSPLLFKQYKNLDLTKKQLHSFPCFLQCLDVYFSHEELQKQSKVEKVVKEQVLTKTDKICIDQERRLEALTEQQNTLLRYACLLENNTSLVQQTLEMVQMSLNTGVTWKELMFYIKQEKKKGHPLASIIHTIHFETMELVLLLSASDQEDNQETLMFQDEPVVAVPIDLTQTVHQNIASLHQQRKQLLQKKCKTEQAMRVALKKAQLEEEKKKNSVPKRIGFSYDPYTALLPIRKRFWFEKFHWFISSSRFLVLAGMDATQNDMLYRRHLKKNDIFVHADTHGAPAVIIKNFNNVEIPVSTLIEAGWMAVCRSSAWTQKLITGAWWVYASQVSKTVPPGEYTVSGSFIIRGKKNFLAPCKLEMGVGILFQLGEDSLAHYEKELTYSHKEDDNEHYAMNGFFNQEKPKKEIQHSIEIELEKEDEAWRMEMEERLKRREEKKKQWIKSHEISVSEIKPHEQSRLNKKMENVKPCDKTQTSQMCLTRGKKSKLKRVKNKYKDQDPEEQMLRMKLLGSKLMKGMQPLETNDEKSSINTFNIGPEHSTIQEDSHLGDVSDYSNKKSLDTFKPFALNQPTNISNEASSATETMQLRCLVPQPRKHDTLISAVPVCAPLLTLQHYKYKAKLKPGNLKKGQAASKLVHYWNQHATDVVEKKLIRSITSEDLNHVLPSNLHIICDSDTSFMAHQKKCS